MICVVIFILKYFFKWKIMFCTYVHTLLKKKMEKRKEKIEESFHEVFEFERFYNVVRYGLI